MKNQKWKVGKHKSVVVSDTKIQNTNFPSPPNPEFSEEKDIEYYGGYLICESVGNDKIAQLIAAAPELLKACQNALRDVQKLNAQLIAEGKHGYILMENELNDAINLAVGSSNDR